MAGDSCHTRGTLHLLICNKEGLVVQCPNSACPCFPRMSRKTKYVEINYTISPSLRWGCRAYAMPMLSSGQYLLIYSLQDVMCRMPISCFGSQVPAERPQSGQGPPCLHHHCFTMHACASGRVPVEAKLHIETKPLAS